ncbi:MAG: FMN-binding protein [Elusimicrobia bacterium]|nr:FMN-binding protein [Elusimicrobiota bacterium]
MWKIFFALLLGLPSQHACAKVFLTQKEALRLAFPEGKIERKTVFLRKEEVEAIEELAQAKMESRLIHYYVGRDTTGAAGYAFFETHTVRTMPETFMAVLSPDGNLRSVEILAFYEPPDYLPRSRWLALFEGRRLDDSLWVKRGIRNVAGATLTTQAITQGLRRILATFQVIQKRKKEVGR